MDKVLKEKKIFRGVLTGGGVKMYNWIIKSMVK